jgi:tetratricopeptide (TPR) repeat protein
MVKEIDMGFRFFKRIKLMPGVTMNLSKSAPSFSFGPRGMKYTVGASGTRTTLGIPGTGLYYTKLNSRKKKNQDQAPPPPQSLAEAGFFRQLFSSPEEKSLLQGMRKFLEGNQAEAYQVLQQNANSVDSQFMCGFIALGQKKYEQAERHFRFCQQRLGELGQTIKKLGGDFEMLLEVTEFIEAPVLADQRGLTLAMVEAYQHQDKYQLALQTLTEIWNSNPSDKVILLSLTDLVANSLSCTNEELKEIAELTSDVENQEPIDANILYLRAYVLYRLGLKDAAIKLMGAVARKKKDRPRELLLCAKYMRGQMYEEIGETKKANKDYQEVYAEDPQFEDVAAKLCLS